MATTNYIGIIERGLNGTFGVYFPDFPGCVSAGDSLEETIDGGQEALDLHVEGMRADGLEVPAPSSADTVQPAEGSDFYKLVWFSVDGGPAPAETPQRYNVSLPPSLIAQIDALADQEGGTRSGLISVAARELLAARRRERGRDAEAPFDFVRLSDALEEARRRATELPYAVTFTIHRGFDQVIARGTRTSGMRVNGATTGRPLRDFLTDPEAAFTYMFGFLDAALGEKKQSA